MEFRIADTFTQSLARLTVEEQKQVKQSTFTAQVKPGKLEVRPTTGAVQPAESLCC